MDLGLRAGQTQTITYIRYGINAQEFLIEAADVQGMGLEQITTVTAVVGPDIGSWCRYFTGIDKFKGQIMDRLNVGSNQILIIMAESSEIWEWQENVSYTIFACPVVALNLYPSVTTYPC